MECESLQAKEGNPNVQESINTMKHTPLRLEYTQIWLILKLQYMRVHAFESGFNLIKWICCANSAYVEEFVL